MNANKPLGLNIAKLVLITLLLFANLPIQANSQPLSSVKVSLAAAERMSYEQLFKRLEQQIAFTFLYKKEDLEGLSLSKVDWSNQPLNKVLEELLGPEGLTYIIDDKVIVIRKAANPNVATGASSAQQERILRGKVTGENGDALAGVTVHLKGDGKFLTQTNDRGIYELRISNAPEKPVLIFTHVGMETLEAAVGPNNTLDVRMTPSMNQLEETVIVGGYGLAQKRLDMVGSAFQVTAEQLKTLPAQRVDAMLEGIVPGLQVDFNTDAASSTRPRMTLRVRGEASLSASNEPIWVVDGIRVFTGDRTNMIPGMETAVTPLSYLNPDDIESITVLKDATMSSIYGADGANGVVLITTKKGRKSSPSLSFSSKFGLAQINESTRFKVLDGPQYMELAKESYLNIHPNLEFFPYQDVPDYAYSTTNTDWYDVFYGTGIYNQNNISVNGGNESLSYHISGEYFLNESTIRGNRQDRFALRSNLDFGLTSKLNLKLMMSASYNVNDIFNPSNDYYEFLPIYSPYNEDGSFRLWTARIAQVIDPANRKSWDLF